MRKLVTFLLILLFATSAFGQSSVWFNGSFDDAKKKAENEGKLLLINFYSDG